MRENPTQHILQIQTNLVEPLLLLPFRHNSPPAYRLIEEPINAGLVGVKLLFFHERDDICHLYHFKTACIQHGFQTIGKSVNQLLNNVIA